MREDYIYGTGKDESGACRRFTMILLFYVTKIRNVL